MVDSKVLIQFTGNSLKEFSKLGVSFEVANNNITKLFEQSIEEQRKKRILREIMLITIGKDRFIESFDLDEYHSYDEIEEYLKNIAGKSSSTLGAKLISIGKSFENRNIYAMTISKEALVKKKILLLECKILIVNFKQTKKHNVMYLFKFIHLYRYNTRSRMDINCWLLENDQQVRYRTR